MIQLIPAQTAAYRVLRYALNAGDLLLLRSVSGRGRTTVLKKLHEETGGAFVNSKDFIEGSGGRHPLALPETFHDCVAAALRDNKNVYVDDADLIHDATSSCTFYPRGKYIEAALLELSERAVREGKKLVLSTDGSIASSFSARCFPANIGRYSDEDYAALLAIFLGAEQGKELDAAKIFRFAPKLTAHQIRVGCDWLKASGALSTEQYIEYLRSQRLASNVDLGEVDKVDLHDLQGVDDVIRSLETHIVLPLSDDSLSAQLGLRPKRGVLLYGPPGTGKTTVGRALAHRLRGKFFLVDGTFIAGSRDFYARIHQIFESAKENSPAVIFIDDADAIFEDGEERGLYRYLLTMIDGLESEGRSRVCVMMTAMNLSHLPPALVRSGRVELWLEMKLPDSEARRRLLEIHTRDLPKELTGYDHDRILSATEGFTGADIKRLIEDAKALYGFDRASGKTLRSATEYVDEAATGVRENKERYDNAEIAAQRKPKTGRRFYYPTPQFDDD
jgi:transitional endoplasmic reticulum ATPase